MSAPVLRHASRSELHVLQVMVAGDAFFAVVYMIGDSTLVDDGSMLSLWYRLVSWAPWLLSVAAGVALPWCDIRRLRRWQRAVAAAAVAALAVLLLICLLPQTRDQPLPWRAAVMNLAAQAAIAGWGERGARIVLPAVAALAELLRFANHHGGVSGVVSDAHNFVTAIGLVVVWSALLASARAVDRTAAELARSSAARAADAARVLARNRTQELVHDEVFTALLLAAQGGNELRPQVSAQAARASQLIHQIEDHTPDRRGSHRPLPDLVASLDELTHTLDARASWVDGTPADPTISVPEAVARAVLEATRQALVNSLKHAGDGVHRTVTVAWHEGVLSLAVIDDGRGYDPDAVPAGRMGVAVSILGRMASLEGGRGSVESRPGAGTTVTLTWRSAADEPARAEDDAVAHERTSPRYLFEIVAFSVAQIVIAAVVGSRDTHAWVSYAALAGILAALVTLGWTSLERVTTARASAVLALTVATAALTFVPLHGVVDATDAWYLSGLAFLLMILALRGRLALAVAGIVLSTLVAGLGLAQSQASLRAANVGAPAFMVLATACCLLAVRHLNRRAAGLRQAELIDVKQYAWQQARLEELRSQADDLDRMIGPMLDHLASDEPLTTEQLRECAALEGRLRDQYRGGRLSRQPLVDAVMRARARGVDVVLLDDANGVDLADDVLHDIARWMTQQLATVTSGRFTGRILPPGREGLASAVTTSAGQEAPTLFRG